MAGAWESTPTRGAQLAYAARLFDAAGLPGPEREAAELLGHLLGVPAAMLAAQPDAVMRPIDVQTYAAWVARRAGGVPTPYITGHLEFMGLDIAVGWDSPLPSPGTARLVEVALQWARNHAPGELVAVDLGTGCGAVALALAALEPRFARIYALDTSPETLARARSNGERYLLNLVINWLDGDDGLDTIPEAVDLIVWSRPAAPRWVVEQLARASPKLRPGGVLICATSSAERLAVTDALMHSAPDALTWTEFEGNEHAIVVAQFARHTDHAEGENSADV